jgi:RNA polymerase sigma-70 factor (ECF subfamily)
MLRAMRVALPTSLPTTGDGRVAADEETLVARARGGDRDAFGLLVEAHLDRVWNLVWRVLRHQEDTEDVVQEVFLTAWQALPGFRGEARLMTWLQTIAVNRALNHRARGAERLRKASIPLERSRDDGAPGLAGGGSGPGRADGLEPADTRPAASPLLALEAGELRHRLSRCLERLPAAWRAILALREGGERSYEEIAATLGLAIGTVRSRLARARLALRDCVEGSS